MPELPEVETVARDLKPLLTGKTIQGVWWSGKKLRFPWQQSWASLVQGQTFQEVKRRAKWLILYLGKSGKPKGDEIICKSPKLIAHLGMTGQLTFVRVPTQVSHSTLPDDHVHLCFDLGSASGKGLKQANKKVSKDPEGQVSLRFRDIRRFGGIHLAKNQVELEAFFEKHPLGPEPWDCSLKGWREALARTSRAIKVVLLDQTIVSGLGNIYADESLHASRIHPCRSAYSLSESEAGRLLSHSAEVMRQAIENRGSTIRDYVGGENLNGRNQDFLQVYGREGQPCFQCGSEVVRWILGGRSSHFCPRCQPETPGLVVPRRVGGVRY